MCLLRMLSFAFKILTWLLWLLMILNNLLVTTSAKYMHVYVHTYIYTPSFETQALTLY